MQLLKKNVEAEVGQEITDEQFFEGFQLAFNRYEKEMNFKHGRIS